MDRRRRLGLTVSVVAAVLLSGCGSSKVSPTAEGADLRPAEMSGCPGDLARLVDSAAVPTAETVLALDFSGSFISTDAARARMHAQVRSLVQQSVESSQALRILAFTRTASGAFTIVTCPSLAPRYNNEAARSRKVENLKRKAAAAVDVALDAAIRTQLKQRAGRGTSIVGGFLAIEESAPLVRAGIPRDAVMFSDGQGLDEEVPVDLSAFRSVSLYGVGASVGESMGTQAADAAAKGWVHWLAEHGANRPNASTQAMF